MPARTAMKVIPRRSPTRPSWSDPAYLLELEIHSNTPEVQQILRDAIRRQAIRVCPIPGCSTHVKVVGSLAAPGREGTASPLAR